MSATAGATSGKGTDVKTLRRVDNPFDLRAGDRVFVVRFGSTEGQAINELMMVRPTTTQLRLRVRAASTSDLVVGLRPIADLTGGEAYLVASPDELVNAAGRFLAGSDAAVSVWLLGHLKQFHAHDDRKGLCFACDTRYPCDERRSSERLAAHIMLEQ